MIIKKEIFEQLSKELRLPYTGIEQDWDLEMANSKRLKDFIEFYRGNELSSEKKIAIMSLIIASYEDFLNENDLKRDNKWIEIKSLIESQKVIFQELINRWALPNESNNNNIFKITPLMRTV
ncbi:hypothetical protein J2X97_002805 [Epilithonimonas hungarica]|uniref:hypothetical protein n=1 Tax=Epilithonimonas hungarica TaxID=454006 RepID=UPI0027840470|nr:hypothetical protein [Epilithonimonas hungarica]MDP9957139.1 hypothetical protein [Epilithonimonas hungarica]